MLAGIDFNALENVSVQKFPGSSIGYVVESMLPYVFTFSGIMLLLYLLFGGFSLMTSRGDPKAVEAAKGKITYALLGFIIIFTAYWVTQVLGIILGIDIINVVF